MAEPVEIDEVIAFAETLGRVVAWIVLALIVLTAGEVTLAVVLLSQ